MPPQHVEDPRQAAFLRVVERGPSAGIGWWCAVRIVDEIPRRPGAQEFARSPSAIAGIGCNTVPVSECRDVGWIFNPFLRIAAFTAEVSRDGDRGKDGEACRNAVAALTHRPSNSDQV